MTYFEAWLEAKKILSQNSFLVQNHLVETEAEQLSCSALFKASGQEINSGMNAEVSLCSMTRSQFFLERDQEYPAEALLLLKEMAQKRCSGVLLQHITGIQYFGENFYQVSPEVLVPRPETEILLKQTIDRVTAIDQLRHECRGFPVLDESRSQPLLGVEIGLGSGILSIELLSHFMALRMVASELSPQAREVATKNALRILGDKGISRLEIRSVEDPLSVLEVFAGLEGQADFLISNPPYLASVGETMDDVSNQEPALALFAPEHDLLFFYREIAAGAQRFLKPGGWVFVEIPHERAERIEALFKKSQWMTEVVPDLTNRSRVVFAQLRE